MPIAKEKNGRMPKKPFASASLNKNPEMLSSGNGGVAIWIPKV